MVGPVGLALCGTLLAVCVPFAVADSVTVTGNVNFAPDSLTFSPPFATAGDSGIFAGFSGGTVDYMLGTVNYTQGLPQTTEAFTITDSSGNVLAFYDSVNAFTKSTDSAGDLDVSLTETGYYTFNGGAEMAGYFDLSLIGTSADGAVDPVAFTGTGGLSPAVTATGVTPEPNSMLLLGSGLLGSAALLRRRRLS